MQAEPLRPYIIRVFLLLPLMYAGWYYCGSLLANILAPLLHQTLSLITPGVFAPFKALAANIEVNTVIPVADLGGPYTNASGELAFDTNPMVFGYGLPFFLALFFAAPKSWDKALWKLIVGLLVMLAVQLWGASFDTFKTLLFSYGPTVAAHLDMSMTAKTFIAYGYQLGTLILPVIAPVALWFGLFNDSWRQLAGEAPPAPPEKPRNSFSVGDNQ